MFPEYLRAVHSFAMKIVKKNFVQDNSALKGQRMCACVKICKFKH